MMSDKYNPDAIATHMCARCGKNYAYKVPECTAMTIVGGQQYICGWKEIIPVGADY